MKKISFNSLGSSLASRFPKSNTPIAFIYCLDHALLPETIAHYRQMKFAAIVLFYQSESQIIDEGDDLIYVELSLLKQSDFFPRLYTQISGLESKWIYWCFNGEFLFYPFSETRCINDYITFLLEEKRGASFGMLIDAYAWSPTEDPLAISLDNVGIDTKNYYREPVDPKKFLGADDEVLERIIDVRGGLRWRMMEYVQPSQHTLSRVPLLQIKSIYSLDEYGKLDEPEIYTQKCKYHANPTSCVISFRLMLDLLHSPKSRSDALRLHWEGSEKFNWTSPQLLRLGIIETGQWF